MSRMYYDMREAKVNIAHYLMHNGWDVHGYKADESDSMTDYYSPAYWDGVATKNGYILCVDVYGASDGRNGSITHLAHPSTSKWHVEKDGVILDKGTGISKFKDIPNPADFDFSNMKYNDAYYGWKKDKEFSQEETELCNQFISLMNRIEKIVSGQSNSTMKKIMVDVTKTVTKPVQITDRDTLQDGDIVTIKNLSGYWKYVVDKIHTAGYYFVLLGKKWETLSTNSQGTTKYFKKDGIAAGLKLGSVKIFYLAEVEETEQVEKWVKDSDNTSEDKQDQKQEITNNNNYSITEDIDTRDNSKIWVVKIIDRLSTDEYRKVQEQFKGFDGYYSKFKHGFIFKYDPTNILNNNQDQEQEKQEEQNNMNDNRQQETEQQEEDIISKFDKVEVTNNSRISDEDETFCKGEQEQYNSAITSILAFVEDIKTRFGIDVSNDGWHREKSSNPYIDPYKFREFSDLCHDVKTKFVHNIVWYFAKQYNVTLNDDSDTIKKKYGFDVTYEQILDDIFIQLGGCTFKEKAEREIKDRFFEKSHNRYTDKSNYELKGDKLTINESYVHFEHGWSGNEVRSSYRSQETIKTYIDAIEWFEYGRVINANQKMRGYETRLTEDEYKSGVPLSGTKVTWIKFFKNGRMDITFKNSQLAKQFAKEFCKHTEQSA